MSQESVPDGFTVSQDVQDILRRYEKARVGTSRRVPFEGLPASAAATLLAKLPPFQQGVAAGPDAPTFADLVEAGLKVTGAVFSGFRSDPDHPGGEQVVLTRVAVPANVQSKDILDALVSVLPGHQDRLKVGGDGSAYMEWKAGKK